MNVRENDYIAKIKKSRILHNYEETNVFLVAINERKKSSQVSPIVSNDKPEYVEKLPFQPLPPKVKKKKKKRRGGRGAKRKKNGYHPGLSILLPSIFILMGVNLLKMVNLIAFIIILMLSP